MIILLLGLAVLLFGGGSEGIDLFAEGRFEEAHAVFVAECEAAGDDADAKLNYNRALAALRIGNLSDAEESAARAEPGIGAAADFLRGNAAFARCEMAEQQAGTVESEPFAFEIAIRFGEKSRDLWMRAAMSRPDWPEARRNVERAQLMLDSLRGRKKEAERRKNPRPEPNLKPLPSPETTGPEPEAPPDGKITELTPDQVRALYERLAKKEREKRTVREAHRRERMAGVERDW